MIYYHIPGVSGIISWLLQCLAETMESFGPKIPFRQTPRAMHIAKMRACIFGAYIIE